MIAFLEGVLDSKDLAAAVLDVNGVGYEVAIPLSTYDRLPPVGGKARLLIHECIREDAYMLFGFASEEERKLFRLLQGVSGIGPKIAVAALSALSIRELKMAISGKDAKSIARVPGIGKKTAERIVVELADKIDPIEAMAADGSGKEADPAKSLETQSMRDAVLALCALGQPQDAAFKLVRDAVSGSSEKLDTEEIIRRALASR